MLEIDGCFGEGSERAPVLVLNGDERFRGGEGFAILLNEIDCPVILVG